MFLSFGVSKREFWMSTPVELDPYIEAERIRERREDKLNWAMGLYNMRAFSVVASSMFSKHSNATYFEEPLLEDSKSKDKELTEEEKEIMRQKFVASLMIMQANFEMNHKNNKQS